MLVSPVTAAKIKVSPPTLPKNIRRISIPRETSPRVLVIPSVKPTVPMAEAVSKRQLKRGKFSIWLIINPPVRNKIIYMIKMVAEFLTISSDILLPKARVFLRWRNTANADITITAIVVVFIPPAVEPGEPPISISISITDSPVLFIEFRSTELNPAVRAVTD